MEQLKVMQIQGTLYAHTQTHLFFPQPLISLSPPQPQSLSLHLSLQLAMSKRYDVSQQALDLQTLRFDPGMPDSSNSEAGEDRKICLGGRLRDGDVGRGWCWPWTHLHLLILSSWLSEDLVDHDIDIILNRRSCMAATLQIIETNFPKVRP